MQVFATRDQFFRKTSYENDVYPVSTGRGIVVFPGDVYNYWVAWESLWLVPKTEGTSLVLVWC